MREEIELVNKEIERAQHWYDLEKSGRACGYWQTSAVTETTERAKRQR